MIDIPLFKAELDVSGLAEKIIANRIIAYCEPVHVWQPTIEQVAKVVASLVGKAGMHDTDLYYTKSVLVSSNWNKNDDVFNNIEAWAARNTPSHKPTNIEHDEKKMVGHITDSWVIDGNGDIVQENTAAEDLPDLFHIVNGAVIYTAWEDKDLRTRAMNLIEEVKAGKKFVSMECLFTNFDYAMVKSDDSYSIIPRNKSTSHMTKNLRAYGGTGEFEGAKIGRLLRNITFSGKGYVDKPANPDSIIFSDDNILKAKSTTINSPGVNIIIEENNMANEIEQIAELKAQLKTANEAKVSAEDKLAKAGIEKYQSQISELTEQLNAAKKENDAEKKTEEEYKKASKSAQEQIESLTKELATIKEAEATAKRVATLVKAGVEETKAIETVKTLSNISDEQFTYIVANIIPMKVTLADIAKDHENDKDDITKSAKKDDEKDIKDKKDDKEDCSKGKKAAEDDKDNDEDDKNASKADTKVLDSAKSDKDVALTAAGENNKTEKVRAALSEMFASRSRTRKTKQNSDE